MIATSPSRPPPASRASETALAEPTERFGPLVVSRHVKDDGRALILYTLRERPELGERADENGARSDGPGERPA